MHDCFTIGLTGECLKCLFRLTGDVPAVVVQSEALWARIPEIQVRIPSRAMGTFFPHTVSSIFRLSLTHIHTHTHTQTHTHTHTHFDLGPKTGFCRSGRLLLFFFSEDGSKRLMRRDSCCGCKILLYVLFLLLLEVSLVSLVVLHVSFTGHFLFIVTHTHIHTCAYIQTVLQVLQVLQTEVKQLTPPAFQSAALTIHSMTRMKRPWEMAIYGRLFMKCGRLESSSIESNVFIGTTN